MTTDDTLTHQRHGDGHEPRAPERNNTMMQVQIEIAVRGNDNNTVTVNLLEREDANDAERDLAKNIRGVIMAVMSDIRDRLPAGEVEITVIE